MPILRAENRKFHVIYKITCLVNEKFYIGCHSTDDLEDEYFGSGKRIRYSVHKYGKEKHRFEILEFCESRKSMFEREETLVNKDLLNEELCMNLVVGGKGGFDHISKDVKRIAQQKSQAKQQYLWSNDLEWANKISKKRSEALHSRIKNGTFKAFGYGRDSVWIGRCHTEETKKKISESIKEKGLGINNSQFGTCWIYNDETSIKIKKEELDSYLDQGWIKGRKIKFDNASTGYE